MKEGDEEDSARVEEEEEQGGGAWTCLRERTNRRTNRRLISVPI